MGIGLHKFSPAELTSIYYRVILSTTKYNCVYTKFTHEWGRVMPHGDGYFEKYKKGYRFYYHYHCDLDDRVYRLTVTGRTQDECRTKMNKKKRDKKAEVQAEIDRTADRPFISLQEAMSQWLKEEKAGKVKASTYDRNERTLKNDIEGSTIGKKQAAKITPNDISSHLNKMFADKSESTVRKAYELLAQFYRSYYSDDLNANPMNNVPRPRKRNVGEIDIETEDDAVFSDMVLSDEEMKRFKTQVFLPYQRGVTGRPKHGPDLYFMMMTVVRYGEAAALVWGDIDEENRVMYVRRNQSIVVNRDGGSGKTKRIITTPKNSKAREVMLSKQALEALAEIKKRSHHTGEKDFVICSDSGKSLTNHNLRKALDGVMKAIGLSRPSFGLHYLRHTGISYYIRNGVPLEMVSKMAGHSSVAITERIYYHIIHDQQKKMIEIMDGIGSGKFG